MDIIYQVLDPYLETIGPLWSFSIPQEFLHWSSLSLHFFYKKLYFSVTLLIVLITIHCCLLFYRDLRGLGDGYNAHFSYDLKLYCLILTY